LQIQIGASEYVRTVIHHESSDRGEDGIEFAYDETLEYYFLRHEDINSREPERAAVHEIDFSRVTPPSTSKSPGVYHFRELPAHIRIDHRVTANA
jgi:hypothetical protein